MFSSPLIYILSLTWTEALARALGIFTIYNLSSPTKYQLNKSPFLKNSLSKLQKGALVQMFCIPYKAPTHF